ncbi:otoancorin-like [Stegostoma tigrinum]|uniref:otoancorin-like n=1 Tax=Stegostoma tigrinum TaxID=3053191 RepID=UPI002870996D|nr:otoancorin-like [Stegostoma tigrinum]
MPDLPAELRRVLDELLDEKYIEGTIKAVEYLRGTPVTEYYADMLRYLRSKWSSLQMLQNSFSSYFREIVLRPRKLATDLQQMDTSAFLLSAKYFHSGISVELAFTTIDFGHVKNQLTQMPGGNRSLFESSWKKCLPSISSFQCLELVIEALRLTSAVYLQPEMVLNLPKDLQEETFKNITTVFKELYDKMAARTQRAIYEWMRQTLQRSYKPPGLSGSGSWITAENLWFLGRYIVHLPVEEIQKISLNEIRLFINYDNATKQLDSVYDITPATAKAFQERIDASGFDLTNTSTVYRLGLLVCFFDNIQELDTGEAHSLLHQMIKCNRLKGFQVAVRKLKSHLLELVLKNQTLNESLDSISDAIAGLSFTQLESLSPQAVRSAISALRTVAGWTESQMIILVDKFIGDSKQLSLFNISQLGELMLGVSSGLLYNVSAEDLIQAVTGTLSDHAAQLSPVQRMVVVSKMVETMDIPSVLDLLNGSFLKELSLSNLLKVKGYNITRLDHKELRRSQLVIKTSETRWMGNDYSADQALYLYNVVSGGKPGSEIISFSEFVKGLTCEQIQSFDNMTFLLVAEVFKSNLDLLSSHQLNCLAWKYQREAPKLMPPLLLAYLPPAVLEDITQSVCRLLLFSLGRTELHLIIPDSTKRNKVIRRALQCLNYTLQDEYDVDALGRMICNLSPQIIKTNISVKALTEAFMQFRSCKRLSNDQKREIQTKIREYYGNPTAWQPELIQDLGPLVTFLSKEDLTIIAEKFPDILLQLALDVEGEVIFQDFLAVVFSTLKRAIGNNKLSSLTPDCRGLTAPSFDQMLKLADANSYWSAQELRCMSTQTFIKSVERLGALKSFDIIQLAALKDKAKMAWGPIRSWKKYQIVALGRIALALDESEIKELELGSIDTVAALSQQTQWTPTQARSILEGFFQASGLTVDALKEWDLIGLGSLLCAMTGHEISYLSASTYSAAAARIGEIVCKVEILQELLKKARYTFGNVTDWYNFILEEVGTVAAGISKEEIKVLNEELMPYFQPTAIAALPSEVFKELSPKQLANLGPENAAIVTESQKAALSIEQLSSLQAAVDGANSNHLIQMLLSASPVLNSSSFHGGNLFLLWAACIIVYFIA